MAIFMSCDGHSVLGHSGSPSFIACGGGGANDASMATCMSCGGHYGSSHSLEGRELSESDSESVVGMKLLSRPWYSIST